MLGPVGRLGIRNSIRATRDMVRGGGPAGIRLLGVGPPEGIIAPTCELDIEIPLRDGGTTRLSPGLPVPPPAAWAYRIGKAGLAIRDRFRD
ncbi:MAG: hypothetical protein M3355_06715 [Actinomycetota bacterium]|nr:hypothetical protein [Actinomycetota bacterium]